jgi:PTS system mannose-specific IIA component
MISIVVVSHGDLASALVRAVDMIAGPQPALYAVEIGPGESPDTFATALASLLRSIAPSPVLILVDLLGGTPYNVVARHVVGAQAECVSGVNLPMLLELVMSRNAIPLAELATSAESSGRDSIENLGPKLRAA